MSRLICTVRFVSRAYPIIDEINVNPHGHASSADVHPFIFLDLRRLILDLSTSRWYFECVFGCWTTCLIFRSLSGHFVVKIRGVTIFFGLRPDPPLVRDPRSATPLRAMSDFHRKEISYARDWCLGQQRTDGWWPRAYFSFIHVVVPNMPRVFSYLSMRSLFHFWQKKGQEKVIISQFGHILYHR